MRRHCRRRARKERRWSPGPLVYNPIVKECSILKERSRIMKKGIVRAIVDDVAATGEVRDLVAMYDYLRSDEA